MEIRDPVHGSIHILKEEVPIIRDNFFQRLRNIKQLGFSDYVFPGATHTRFLHSIGVMNVGTKAFDKLFPSETTNIEFMRLRETFKLACLLHDVGHAPLSHSTETVMPSLSSLCIPKNFLAENDLLINRQATHEDYTIKAIADSDFSESFSLIEKKFGVSRQHVAELIQGHTTDKEYFIINNKNYFPILHQLVSSEMDCDRMDYLLRDSYFCGVSYGHYDLDWLLDNLEQCEVNNQIFLGISERAVVTFDDFLLSRYHMFVMVYFHYRSVCLEQLLYKYFSSSPGEYSIPANINDYIKHDDHFLMKVMRESKNKYAQQIVKNKIPQKIFESFNNMQLIKLGRIQSYLESENIEFIRCSSSSRLSKYYTSDSQSDNYSLRVVRSLFDCDSKSYTDINQATELFLKFSESHGVNRLHCDLTSISTAQHKELRLLIRS
ncbi:MAG: HD domain-containing protein [Bacteriovoracaceae bacterium]|nr:HD domain-containing protein [Bacteriovoracaceae bacterium]